MITNLLLHNFKSHKKTDLRFSNLTVLTGINSAGKSSVIQSLLLLRQSHQRRIHPQLLYFIISLIAKDTF
ncbi:AAA family ATPase [Bacteroides fragilis]|nr:AAA family ATPase [Bacteroides fragilis]